MLASLESPALWHEHTPIAKQLGNSDATLDEQHEELAGLPRTREKLCNNCIKEEDVVTWNLYLSYRISID